MNKRIVNKRFELNFELIVKNISLRNNDLKYTTDDIENFRHRIEIEIRMRHVVNDVEHLSIIFGVSKLRSSHYPSRVRQFFRLSVGIVDKNRNEVNKMCSPVLNMNSLITSQGWNQFIERSRLLDSNSGLLKDDSLTLYFTLEMSEEMQSLLCDKHLIANTFEKCYKSLFGDNQLSDFMVVANGREFAVHRAVLAARSPVLKAMITNDMKEKKESKIILCDIDEELAEQFLYYLYTGTVPKVNEMAKRLTTVADFFDVPDLKIVCSQTLFRELNDDNVMKALRFGEDYGIRELLLNAIDYIVDNKEQANNKLIAVVIDFSVNNHYFFAD